MSEGDAARRGAVFFDRDGVLNEDVGYLHRIEDFRWITGAREALALVQQAGLRSIVVTNQSGVARGYYGEQDVDRLHAWMQQDLARDGIRIDAFYSCPYLPDAPVERYRAADHPDRKPNPGMILRGLAEWNVDPAASLMVGDKPRDIEAGRRAGVDGLLFTGGNLAEALAPFLAGRPEPRGPDADASRPSSGPPMVTEPVRSGDFLRRGALDRFRDGPLAGFLRGDIFEPRGAAVPAEASHDTVFVGYRLQDIADYRAALQAWFGAVRVGGHLVIVVPHAFLFERQLSLPSRFRPEQRRLYTPRALIEEIEESLAPNSYRVRWLGDNDQSYDYGAGNRLEPVGSGDVMLAIERIAPPAWPLIDTPGRGKADAPDFAFEPPRTRIEATVSGSLRRILILKLDHLGDFIMGLPALEKARATFPDAEITLVVGSWNSAIARDMGVADHVLEFDVFPRNSSEEQVDVVGKTALFQERFTGDYDLAIDLRSDPDTRFLLRSVRAAVRAGLGTASRFPFLDIFLPVDTTRNEPETARIDEMDHLRFAMQPGVVEHDYRVFFPKGRFRADSAMAWGPYWPLRPGRYVFEPYVELIDPGEGILLLDVALDSERVVHRYLPAPQPIRLAFTVDRPGALFEFRIWALDGVEGIDLSLFGGRLIREGGGSVLHQSEYLMLLIELVRMRSEQFGLLQDAGGAA